MKVGQQPYQLSDDATVTLGAWHSWDTQSEAVEPPATRGPYHHSRERFGRVNGAPLECIVDTRRHKQFHEAVAPPHAAGG